MNDYDKIAHAITYIQAHKAQQPSLQTIAEQVHLSPYHFQRLFSRWAGVSPKRFLQVITLEQAKTLLRQPSTSTFEASQLLGLSSSSRLYDHFVQLTAVTPSEFKQQGLGLTIHYGIHLTPYGEVFIAVTDKGICKLSFINPSSDSNLQDLNNDWPKAEIIHQQATTKKFINSIFYHSAEKKLPLSLWVKGTNFQINVWQALLKIQTGQLCSYADIAKQIDKPKACRAVGTAIGANPIAFIIPCHRVVQQSGGLGGYRWGKVRKQALLAKETAHLE